MRYLRFNRKSCWWRLLFNFIWCSTLVTASGRPAWVPTEANALLSLLAMTWKSGRALMNSWVSGLFSNFDINSSFWPCKYASCLFNAINISSFSSWLFTLATTLVTLVSMFCSKPFCVKTALARTLLLKSILCWQLGHSIAPGWPLVCESSKSWLFNPFCETFERFLTRFISWFSDYLLI